MLGLLAILILPLSSMFQMVYDGHVFLLHFREMHFKKQIQNCETFRRKCKRKQLKDPSLKKNSEKYFVAHYEKDIRKST
jgi:hypothetical protein